MSDRVRRRAAKLLKYHLIPTLRRFPGRWEAFRQRPRLKELAGIALFVGYPRSGHSLLGALIDAHPDARIAHELDLLRYVRLGSSKPELLGLMLRRHRWFAEHNREWTGFSYQVDGQDTLRRLSILGDKAGGMSTDWLASDLDLLHKRVGLPLKILHHVRNPWDLLPAVIQRDHLPPDVVIQRMERNLRVLLPTTGRPDCLTTHHEDLITSPPQVLTLVAEHLGLPPEADWIKACERRIFKKPRARTDEITWSSGQRRQIQSLCEQTPWLRRYASTSG